MSEQLPTHDGLIVVHFHGGFLDGHVARSGDTRTGGIQDNWSASTLYVMTAGQVGVGMLGMSPEAWQARQDEGSRSGQTTIMDCMYRVTASSIEAETLTIDVAFEAMDSRIIP